VLKKDRSSFVNKTYLIENVAFILPNSSSKSIQSSRIPIADLPNSDAANAQTSAIRNISYGTSFADYLLKSSSEATAIFYFTPTQF